MTIVYTIKWTVATLPYT